MAVDVLDDDHGAIDNDAEIDRPNRQQVCRAALEKEGGDGEQQRERDDRRHDARAGDVAQEHKQNEHDQAHPDDEVVGDVVRGDMNQIDALVEHRDPHPRRKHARLLDLVKLRLHGAGSGEGFLPSSHQDDPLDDIVLFASPHLPETGLVAHDHGGDLPNEYRKVF